MSAAFRDRYRLAFLSWLATVLMSFAFLPALSEKRFVFAGAFFSALVVLVGVGLRALRTPALFVLARPAGRPGRADAHLLRPVDLKFGVIPTGATFDALNIELEHGDGRGRRSTPPPLRRAPA